MNKYALADLQQLEERCQEKAAKLGLEVPKVLFHLVQSEEMYDIVARHLPGRYSHHTFGREYQKEKESYDKGRSRVYELVINTRPVYAYLLDGNSIIAQLLVIAHVLGHATVYEHNRFFEPADKNILSRTRAGAERIDRYYGEYGRERVEDFIDACQSLQYQRPLEQLVKKHTPRGPEWKVKEFDMLFPTETAKRRVDYEQKRDAFKTQFPKAPERDFLEFFEKHSRQLEDWQRDIISIIRMETDYFTPSMRTNVIHEAQAVYYHQTIVQELMAEDTRFDSDDFTEFQAMNSRVLHPQIQLRHHPMTGEPFIFCTGLNPYLTGTHIYAEVKRICENPTKEERERWPWAGEITWDEKRCELVQSYDDVALLSEFLSPTICERARLFMEPRTPEEYENLRVLKDEAEEVRKVLVEEKATLGIPYVEIVNADYNHAGALLMEHRHDGERGLDEEYARGTLPHIQTLWGHNVVVHTIEKLDDGGVRDVWYELSHGGTNAKKYLAAP